MDDLISRQAAIDAINTCRMLYSGTWGKGLSMAADKLRDLPSAQLATDTNVGTKLDTNLAEVGTDCISRQAATDICTSAIDLWSGQLGEGALVAVRDKIAELPPAEPQIIRCKDCKHHWTYKSMDRMPIERCDLEQTFYDAEVDYCSLAERREDGRLN